MVTRDRRGKGGTPSGDQAYYLCPWGKIKKTLSWLYIKIRKIQIYFALEESKI